MNGQDFYKLFFQELLQKQVIREAELQEYDGFARFLPEVITFKRVIWALECVAEHLRESHTGRICPKRIEKTLESASAWKSVSVKRVVSAFISLVSCDYLELPRLSDWESDIALCKSRNCGLTVFWFELRDRTGPSSQQLLDQVMTQFLQNLSPQNQELFTKKLRGRHDWREITERMIEMLLLLKEEPPPEVFESILERALDPQAAASLN